MAATRAVLFDFGGTLNVGEDVDAVAGATLVHFARDYGLSRTPEELLAVWRQGAAAAMHAALAAPFYLYREIFQDAFRRTFRSFGIELSEAQTAAMDAYARQRAEQLTIRLIDGARETLAALRRRGLVAGIVSNSDEDLAPIMAARAGLADVLDFVLTSEAARSCKPDPGIFRAALRRAGCAPDEAIFVGDQPEQDIAGANRAGLRSVLYAGPGAALAGHIARENLAGDARPQHTITSPDPEYARKRRRSSKTLATT